MYLGSIAMSLNLPTRAVPGAATVVFEPPSRWHSRVCQQTAGDVTLLAGTSAVWHHWRRCRKQRATATTACGVISDAAVMQRLTKEDEPEIHLGKGLFGASQLQELISLCDARHGFAASVQRRKDGEVVVDQHRTSSSCPMLWPLMTPPDRLQMLRDAGNVALAEQIEQELRAVQAVQRRCAQVIGVEQERIEPLQLVKYLPGQYYSPHMDTHEEPERKSSYAGEQRTHTMLVFLSDVPESDGGGHLHFPRLGLHIQPHLGDAVLWRNLTEDGQPDLRVLHEGVAPKSCEKLAMNVWVADRPFSLSAIQAWQASSSSAKPAASQFLD
ncbi:Prolyl 4-hydroxylase 1 (AtP4H-1) (AtP4H1) [Durusdinium trenchii]|uniref:Prolyl 4-hydroxylase 1 (AtP4H-1) (AtP4H1) n=1 Tax=Durusdinium trenchii TaxID=1381693 RepID=A0ABP0PWA7_9DINO